MSVIDDPGRTDESTEEGGSSYTEEYVYEVVGSAFAADYYLKQYPDVRQSGIDPLNHYLQVGCKEGRNPSAVFSTRYYLEQNPDVVAANLNPLFHYITDGIREGRRPVPLPAVYKNEQQYQFVQSIIRAEFDAAFYSSQYPGHQREMLDPLEHFLLLGYRAGNNPAPGFSVSDYLAANPDVRASGVNPYYHYLVLEAFGADNFMAGIPPVAVNPVGGDVRARDFSAVDHVLLVFDRYILINGWICLASEEIESITLTSGDSHLDITDRVTRYMRRDLFPAYPWSTATEALGFLCLLPGLRTSQITITIRAHDGRTQIHECRLGKTDQESLARLIGDRNVDFSRAVLLLLSGNEVGTVNEQYKQMLSFVHCNNMASKYERLDSSIESPDYLFACIDKAYPLGADGLLVYGWYWSVDQKPVSLKVYDDHGRAVPVQATALIRRDVVDAYRERRPAITPMCGFVCLAPVATRSGEMRVLSFDFGILGEIWLKVPTQRPKQSGIDLVREMIGMISEPMGLAHRLYDLFDASLGPAIQAVTRRSNTGVADVMVRQFGTVPDRATSSVIVPLYGRCDFMRYQLSHFANDPEFAECDLIYVVDDPSLVSDALTLAARFQPLFGIPFRVLWYGENRGFAGANNIGVQHATTDYVVLMNSDVLPQHPGWLGKLRRALDTLDGAGAVGPLLEFADGSIQHAGMRPFQDASLPGFLLNTHPLMGTRWEGGDQPSEQVMLTAACLMLSRENYLSVGGLDEGYLVGDFEDSDLCLSLRKLGYRLWLVPEARLWHLERQSVSLSGAAITRQMITLYNGWRYRQKILRGELIDPCSVEVMQ